MADEVRTPDFESLMVDLQEVRERGVGRLREMQLDVLGRAAQLIAGDADADPSPATITVLLRSAVDTLGGGSLQEAAEYALGLYPGTALWKNSLRRSSAAEAFGSGTDTYRKKHEAALLGQVAEAILVLYEDARLRRVRNAMEARRHPADSRLAVQWVERFEAYYRLWTPAYALAADLRAAIDTYLEPESDHPPWDPDSDEPYDRDTQARGYGRSALYRLAEFWLEAKRFQSKHGGLWLLSDPQVEEDVADAVYRIGWHNPLSDRDESFLRRHLADSRHEEPAQFWDIIQAFSQGQQIDRNWQAMILEGVPLKTEQEKAARQVWLTITACDDYCRIIDEEWLKIADWYRPESRPRRTVTGASLYRELLQNQAAVQGSDPEPESKTT